MTQNSIDSTEHSVSEAKLSADLTDEGNAENSSSGTYKQILKSSAIIGGSSLFNIAIGIVRTKAMALILGPSGFGLMGLYNSITDLTQSVAGMGVNSSGVRQIAEAVGSGNEGRIALTAQVLRRTSFFLGILGAIILCGFSDPIANLTFGNSNNASAVALLSIAVFFNLLSAGQGALIQGMRRISDLARMNILGALFGTLISIPTVYYLKEDGVVLSLVLISAAGLITSWWYRRKIDIAVIPILSSQLEKEQTALLKLGFAFMSSGLMMTGAAYVVRIFIVHSISYDAAGLYQSAWSLGGMYIGFILQAMGTDFYPRLTGIIHDSKECNRVVNEQAHISLLMAGPGVLATLTLAPIVIELFYSAKFQGAVEILRWLCMGMTLRVISWPMGYIIVAKGAQKLLILSELAWTLIYLGLAWICVNHFGIAGAGIAFFGSYIFHILMVYWIVRYLTDFRWSSINLNTSLIYTLSIGTVFSCFYLLPSTVAIVIGILATLLSSSYSVRSIISLISHQQIPRPLLRLLTLFRLVPKNVSELVSKVSEDTELVSIQRKSYPMLYVTLFVGFSLFIMALWISGALGQLLPNYHSVLENIKSAELKLIGHVQR